MSANSLSISERLRKAIQTVNPELWVIFLVVLVAGLLNAFVVRDFAFLNVYNIVIVVAAFLFGRKEGTLSAVLCILVVVLLTYFNPGLFQVSGENTLLNLWCGLAVWAGFLLLTATLIGTLYERQQRTVRELRNTYFGVLEILTAFISKDKYTQHHSYRVSLYAVRIASEMGLSSERQEDIRAAGLLHDLGKLDISRDILYKAARLNEDEFAVMKSHVIKGYQMLSPVGGSLRRILPIILAHHDKFDGTGYNPTQGEEIPLEARILSVADVYDSLTSDRPYRKAMSPYAAREIIVQGNGKDFDPVVVEAFQRAFSRHYLEIPEVLVADASEAVALA